VLLVVCTDDVAMRALLKEGKDLQYVDTSVYNELSHIIDTVDQSADIVRHYFADTSSDKSVHAVVGLFDVKTVLALSCIYHVGIVWS